MGLCVSGKSVTRLPDVRAPMRRGTATALALTGTILLAAAPVSATTGPTILPPARYQVAPALALPYCGRYELQRAVPAVALTRGTMTITLTAQGYLAGELQAYGKDAHHWPTMWLASLYNFDLVPHGPMVMDILGQGYTSQLGRMSLKRDAGGDLTGRITLGRTSAAIAWRPVRAVRIRPAPMPVRL